ncbi:MAG: helix-turn-helix protein, partial [Adhaeribacter sp.]|nr:helix-turn-helix protein [Adhaeribacter sp.]
MEKIPVRHLIAPPKEPDLSGNFSIRDIRSLLAGEDLVQELHRHDFFYLLALKEGAGVHDIDFNPYVVCENSVFFMRPGQVHRLILKAGSTGYLMQFKSDFHFPHHQESNQLLFKASNMNLYQLDADKFQKLLALLAYIFQEYTTKHERYQAVINANLSIFF